MNLSKRGLFRLVGGGAAAAVVAKAGPLQQQTAAAVATPVTRELNQLAYLARYSRPENSTGARFSEFDPLNTYPAEALQGKDV